MCLGSCSITYHSLLEFLFFQTNQVDLMGFFNYMRCIFYQKLGVTHSQLLKGLKCESQTENSGRVRSRGTLLSSQHFGGVKGRAGAPGWDQEELTSFIYSHWTCTKPTQGGQCIVGAPLVLGRATGNTDTRDSLWLGLGGSHHLPPYSIFYTSPWGPHPNGFLSRDSHLGVSKSPRLGLQQIPITNFNTNYVSWDYL